MRSYELSFEKIMTERKIEGKKSAGVHYRSDRNHHCIPTPPVGRHLAENRKRW